MPRILIVEDEADVRFVVEHVLLDAGYEVDATGTMQRIPAKLICPETSASTAIKMMTRSQA